MRENEYLQALHFNTILSDDGAFRDNQSVPIVLSVSAEAKEKLEGNAILSQPNNKPLKYLFLIQVSVQLL